jgi:predicted RNA-binding Zn ribbon-like protein
MMPTVKKDTYEVVVTFSGESNAAITVGGLTNEDAQSLLHHLATDWTEDVSVPTRYREPNGTAIVLVPTAIHALQVLQEVEYIPHPPEE